MPEPQGGYIPEIEETESGESLPEIVPAEINDVNDLLAALDSVLPDDSEPLSEEDAALLATLINVAIESGLDQDMAESLASNTAALSVLSDDQATAVFSNIDAGALDASVAAQIVDAVQDAPNSVREVFEDVVDLFQGAFDEYTMLGSTINVGQRRTVVAVAALTTAISTAGGMTAPSSPRVETNNAARKEDEESEPSGEIAGDGIEWITQIRIFRNVGGVRVVDWKAAVKKFGYGVMNMGFTLAGSAVVYLTLSGPVQKIAGITTIVAFAAAMYLHMKEPEDN